MRLPLVSIGPVLSPAQAKRYAGKFLTRADYDYLIERNTIGKVEGETKFLFLRGALSSEAVEQGWRTLGRLRFANVRNSHRLAFRRCYGGEMVMGYLPSPQPRRTRPTERFPLAYSGVIHDLCFAFGDLIASCDEYLPGYWQQQVKRAAMNGPYLIGAGLRTLVGDPGIRVIREDGSEQPFTAEMISELLFSTVTINDSVICPCHTDGKNVSGFSCLAAFGRWAGGALCFPRLRVAFELRPGDVLIADMQEQHGNVAPLVGTRISVVAYLRSKG
ncbi:MAG TPA: hypothetical protein VF123_09530 [Candidatus Sulfotelmatobacter sp.]